MDIVVDCNVLISAGISNGACRLVIEKVLSEHHWLFSDEIWLEYKEVTARSHLKKYRPIYSEALETVARLGRHLAVTESIDNPLDPDDAIYELAITGRADAIITGNIKHFPPSIGGTSIITPRQFLDKW